MSIERNPHLETISDRIRRGEPVSLAGAMAAIDYQNARLAKLAEQRQQRWYNRLRRWLAGARP